jgi:type II restriction enzyme
LTAIHHLFLTPNVIAKRKPLSASARRAGWVGCNIRLDLIAPEARIPLVGNGRPCDTREVRSAFHRFDGLRGIKPAARGWTTLTLRVISGIGQKMFSLSDLYARERIFAASYPENKNVRAKVRQQLQVLRDLGYLEFSGRGFYRTLF